MRVATIRVGGMTCSACSGTVEKALSKASGVHSASVSLVTCMARVEFQPDQTSAADLMDTIDTVGFDASLEEDRELAPQLSNTDSKSPGSDVLSVEIKVEGMTCSACSNTVERHLKGLKGVKKATVSLILARAYAVCEPTTIDPQGLCREIEDIGFDAELVNASPVDKLGGRAFLHVRVVPSIDGAGATVLDAQAMDLQPFRAQVRSLHGVLDSQTTAEGLLRVIYDPCTVGARQLLRNLEQLDSSLSVEWAQASPESEQLILHTRHLQSLRYDLKRATLPCLLIFILQMLIPRGLPVLDSPIWRDLKLRVIIIVCLATPVHFIVGKRFHVAALHALKRMSPNMDVLVSVATNTSYFYSLTLLVIFIFTHAKSQADMLVEAVSHFLAMGPLLILVVCLGKSLEAQAKLKAMEALTDLPSCQPSVATLCEHDRELSVPLEQVEINDVLRVHAGAKVPSDGIVQSDCMVTMDESMLTGESLPVSKAPGDLVMAGTTCLSGGFLMCVTKVGMDTTLGQMMQLVQDAQASKAPVQRVADSVARVFVPSVISLAVFTFSVWALLVFSEQVHMPESDAAMKLLFAMKFGMAVLMIACPCAMGLATPMAVMVATGLAAQRGCMIKSAEALETSSHLDVVVLDKTGTITEGAMSMMASVCVVDNMQELAQRWASFRELNKLAGADTSRQGKGLDGHLMRFLGDVEGMASEEVQELSQCFWWLLGTIESASDHPIAKCITAAVEAVPGLPELTPPRTFEYSSGRGVSCIIEQLGGVTARVGNVRYFEETDGHAGLDVLSEWLTTMQQSGHTVVLLHVDGQPLGAVAMKDSVRSDARWVVHYLQQKLNLEVWMCTGDNTATAQAIAQEVGIQRVVAEALPSTKRDCVEQLQERRGRNRSTVCFVGDGMNDSPALAQADVGIAIGVGARVAVEAADMTLVRSELVDLVSLLSLGQATMRTIKLNFFWAFCFNFACLPLAAGVLYPKIMIPPLIAGMGMAASSFLVVTSSLLIRLHKPPVHRSLPGEASSSDSIKPLVDESSPKQRLWRLSSESAAWVSKHAGRGGQRHWNKDANIEKIGLTEITSPYPEEIGKRMDGWAEEP